MAFVQVLEKFAREDEYPRTVHPEAEIGAGVELGDKVHISKNVSIGANSKIGNNVTLLPGVVVGENCRVGAGSTLFPNVTLYSGVTIGEIVVCMRVASSGRMGSGTSPSDIS